MCASQLCDDGFGALPAEGDRDILDAIGALLRLPIQRLAVIQLDLAQGVAG